MSFYSDKNSGSTVKLTLRGRLSRRRGSSEKRDSGLGNGRQNKTSAELTRSLEGSGYLRYGLVEGSDVYISTSSDDPFIDYDEPKPEKTGGRFLSRVHEETSEPNKLFKNALPEVKFTESDFEEKVIFRDEWKHITTPQTATTSSTGTMMTEGPNVVDFNEEPLYDVEPVENNGSVLSAQVEDIREVDIERLPASSAHAERLPAAFRTQKKAIVEVSKPIFVLALPPTLQYLRISPPSAMLALPPYSQILAVVAPAEMFLLPEALASEEEIEAAMEGTEESANAIMATLPSGLYTEGVEPIADAVASEEDVISVNANCPLQVAETSSSTEEKLVDYADYIGYDFLPEVTEPVRREPRRCEPTISQMPEYIEIGNEISGMMILTVPELASDAFEIFDSSSVREEEIPEDGMEALGISIDSARDAVNDAIDADLMIGEAFRAATALSEALFEEDVECKSQETFEVDLMIGEAFRAATALSEALFEEDVECKSQETFEVDLMIGEAFRAATALSEALFEEDVECKSQETFEVDLMIGEAFRAATALSEALFEEVKENVPHTLTIEDKAEVSEMIKSFIEVISEPKDAPEEVLVKVSEELPEIEEVRMIKPRISFIFGNGAKTYSFY